MLFNNLESYDCTNVQSISTLECRYIKKRHKPHVRQFFVRACRNKQKLNFQKPCEDYTLCSLYGRTCDCVLGSV
nr:MAG TPA: hypothetical protein [Caudoviricetes sp.]